MHTIRSHRLVLGERGIWLNVKYSVVPQLQKMCYESANLWTSELSSLASKDQPSKLELGSVEYYSKGYRRFEKCMRNVFLNCNVKREGERVTPVCLKQRPGH